MKPDATFIIKNTKVFINISQSHLYGEKNLQPYSHEYPQVSFLFHPHSCSRNLCLWRTHPYQQMQHLEKKINYKPSNNYKRSKQDFILHVKSTLVYSLIFILGYRCAFDWFLASLSLQ